jgi:hypothetical protein
MNLLPTEGATDTCGCCEGVTTLTPLPTANRPGLDALQWRSGTHAAFLASMLARLSSQDYPALRRLTTRQPDDATIALLDAWATVGDVLTFYNERIANEGYLRTATERRSILELARLVGYTLRPGVAATTYLAFTLDDNTNEEVTIPAGTRVQSLPGPGEQPQSFETSDPLKAKARWNQLRPRLTRPQTVDSIGYVGSAPGSAAPAPTMRVYLKGINTNLKAGDMLLIQFGEAVEDNEPIPFRVLDVQPDAAADRTLVLLGAWLTGRQPGPTPAPETVRLIDLVSPLIADPSRPPFSANRQKLDLARTFAANSDASLQLLQTFEPRLREVLAPAIANAVVTEPTSIRVFAPRVKASLFGYNAQKRQQIVRSRPEQSGGTDTTPSEPPVIVLAAQTPIDNTTVEILGEWPVVPNRTIADASEETSAVYLDGAYDKILPASWVVIDTSAVTKRSDGFIRLSSDLTTITTAQTVQAGVARSEYGLSGKTTRLGLQGNWIGFQDRPQGDLQFFANRDFAVIRRTVVYAQSEELALAEEPVGEPICGDDPALELDGLYNDLQPGRWLIISGERADIEGASGVRSSELLMLAEVTHDLLPPGSERTTSAFLSAGSDGEDNGDDSEHGNGPPPAATPQPLPGDKIHTYLRFATPLAYCYKRDTVTLYGNVAKATHGETRTESLGNGDGSKSFQAFTLKQSPLTFVPAITTSGVESSLLVRVNDIRWHEADSLAALGPADRNFITQTDDDDKTTIRFGNGVRGARLPTGMENVSAVYRFGIGKPGNLKAGQLSLLMSRPLHVKEVINPLPASGGADKESRDQARQNVPLALYALDRLVSVRDYADFARTFAGVGTASAARLSDGRRQVVHITIAGADDIPITEDSDLFLALRQALHQFGDPHQPLVLAVRELLLIVLSVRVRLHPDYLWEAVAPQIRAKLEDTFSFERRQLGQDVLLSEVISVIQAVPGVTYVDVEAFGSVPQMVDDNNAPGRRRLITPDEITAKIGAITNQNGGTGPAALPPPRIEVKLADSTNGSLRPAQIAYLSPAVEGALILNLIES